VFGMAAAEPDLSKAKLTPCARINGKVLVIEVPENAERGVRGMILPLDLVPYRNHLLQFRVKAAGTGISQPPARHLGLKFMLIQTTANGRKFYAEQSGLSGTFADKELRFDAMIEPDAVAGELRFSMQDVFGKLEYDLASFRMESLLVKQNADHICEYSDAVRSRPVRRGVMSPIRNQADEENFNVLRDWGVNLMRLQLNTSDAWARSEPGKYREFIDDKIENVIPKVLDLGSKYGIGIIIDLHTVPGSALMTAESDGIYGNQKAIEEFLEIWRRIATRFKGHPALYGYGLINEPKQDRKSRIDYWELQKRAAEEIRKIDPETPIYVTSNQRSSQYAFNSLSPLALKNIIYEVHSYDPFAYTHTPYTEKDRKEGKAYPPYPGIFYGAMWDRDSLRSRFKAVRDFQLRHKAKIYVGEFSTRASAPGGDRYLADSISAFEEYGWDWTYHAFREAKIWSVEYAGDADDTLRPSDDNPRKKVLLEAFKKNRPR